MTRAITSYIAKWTTSLTSDNCISIQTITYVTKGLDLSNLIFCFVVHPIKFSRIQYQSTFYPFLETTGCVLDLFSVKFGSLFLNTFSAPLFLFGPSLLLGSLSANILEKAICLLKCMINHNLSLPFFLLRLLRKKVIS